MPLLRAIVHPLFWIILLSLSEKDGSPALAHARVKPQNILVINSYHKGFQWTDDINRAILDQVEPLQHIRVYTEYMDTKRFDTPSYLKALATLYREKYNQIVVDGIICSDNNALEFVNQFGTAIWGTPPVTFCGVNEIDSYVSRLDTARFKGVGEAISIEPALQLAKKITPTLDEVLFVNDGSLTSQKIDDAARLASFNQNLKCTFLSLDEATRFRQALEKLNPARQTIFVLSIFSGKSRIPTQMTKELIYTLNELPVQVWGPWDFLLHKLAIGGHMLQGYQQGALATQILLRRLKGETRIPFATHTPYRWMADQEECTRLGIHAKYFPANTIWVNPEKNWIETHQKTIFYLFVLLNLITLIVLIFRSIQRLRKKAEVNLETSEKRLEVALEAASGGLWDVNTETRQLYISPLFASLLGYDSPEEIKLSLHNWRNIIFPNDINQLHEILALHFGGTTNHINGEIRLLQKNGQPVWFAVYGKVTRRTPQGKPVNITGLIVNIQSQKQFESELTRAKERAEASDKLKSSFLANMSHEIRTPMNAIIGFTEILLTQAAKPEEQEHYLKIVKNSGENLLGLINDLIDVSKIESGYLHIIQEQVELNQLMDSVEAICRQRIQVYEKQLELQIVKTKPGQFFLVSDKLRLEQILLNLCINAIKFTDKGLVLIQYEVLEHHVRFSVKDTGPGIAPEHIPQIFDRFRQLNENNVRKYSGTGLGLSITKSLISMLKGEIFVQSKLGEGSEFSFVVPYHRP